MSSVALLLSAPLAAQVEPTGSDSPVLEEVVVTARKRVESLQSVPVSVSVVGGEKISEANLQNLQELAPYVPNFAQAQTPTANVIFIRGIGSSPNAGFEQSVGVFLDGVYQGRGRQTLAPLFDLKRVEVLRGPQSILFGKNTVAGAVSLLSAEPGQEPEAGVKGLVGTQGERKLEAFASGPLSDTWSGRLALQARHIDGWVENQYNDETGPETDEYGVRMSLAWQPVDTFNALLKLERSSAEYQGNAFEVIQKSDLLGGLIPPQLIGVEDEIDKRGNYGNVAPLDGPTYMQDVVFDNFMLKLDAELGPVTLTSITGYTAYDFTGGGDLDQSPQNLISAISDERFSQWSQELRVASEQGGPVDYIGGIYLQSSELKDDTRVGFQASTFGLSSNTDGYRDAVFDQSTLSASAFFKANWHIRYDFRLAGGLRYTYEHKELDRVMNIVLYDGSTPDDATLDFWRDLLDTVPYEAQPSRSENNWSPMLGLEWDVLDSVMIYSTATTGFKGGGYDHVHSNGERLEELEFEDESATSFELGAKTAFWADRANLNVALFHTRFNDLQVSTYNGTAGFKVSNAAEAVSQGVELDSRFLLTDRLIVIANLAYLDYYFEDYPDAPCTVAQQAAQLESTGSVDGCVNDLSGETTNYAPRWSAALSGTYTASLGQRLELISTLDANYRGAHYLEADLDPAVKQDGYWKLNARVALATVDGQWDVALVAKNLTNVLTLSTAGDVPFGNGNSPLGVPDYRGSFYGVTDRPRSVALEVGYRY